MVNTSRIAFLLSCKTRLINLLQTCAHRLFYSTKKAFSFFLPNTSFFSSTNFTLLLPYKTRLPSLPKTTPCSLPQTMPSVSPTCHAFLLSCNRTNHRLRTAQTGFLTRPSEEGKGAVAIKRDRAGKGPCPRTDCGRLPRQSKPRSSSSSSSFWGVLRSFV